MCRLPDHVPFGRWANALMPGLPALPDVEAIGGDPVKRITHCERGNISSLSAILGGVLLVACLVLAPHAIATEPMNRLGLPVDCELGRDCFVQQMPDIEPGPGLSDPLCGLASYDGHDGWDIRLRTLADISRNVPVVAVARGLVLRRRDGVPDRLSDHSSSRAALKGKECGNGVLVRHEDGLVSQYCHLKMGSIAVQPGMTVERGKRLGAIGASGLAEFPHVHLSIHREDERIEPLTGQSLNRKAPDCGDLTGSLFTDQARDQLARTPLAILKIGLTAAPPALDELVLGEPPAIATSIGNAMIAWVWAINVEAGDRFKIRIVQPDGSLLVEHTSEPLARRKANYIAYAGRKRSAMPGSYTVSIEMLRDNISVISETKTFEVAGPRSVVSVPEAVR